MSLSCKCSGLLDFGHLLEFLKGILKVDGVLPVTFGEDTDLALGEALKLGSRVFEVTLDVVFPFPPDN